MGCGCCRNQCGAGGCHGGMVVAGMSWLIKILMAHRRMRGLTEAQLQELIRTAGDVESLRLIKEHLERGSFAFPHVETRAPALIQECIDRAKELQWQHAAPVLRESFLERLADPFAELVEWLS